MFLQLAHVRLDVFQQTRALLFEVYRVSRRFPADEKFALTQQVRRAALSAYLNVAEGCSRKSGPERKRFFEISRGSVIEIDTAMDVALELEYCTEEQLENFGKEIISCFRQLSGLIKSLE
jgi:four helix bundle protein